MVDKWYADRPEVLAWQKQTIEKARESHTCCMGAYVCMC